MWRRAAYVRLNIKEMGSAFYDLRTLTYISQAAP